MKDIAIFGAGGLGREVLALIKNINTVSPEWNIIGFFDDGKQKGEMVNNFPVLGGRKELATWDRDLCVAVSVGGPATKRIIIESVSNPRINYPVLIHPSAIIQDPEFVKIGKGSIICAGTIITTNIEIGDFVLLNLCCTVGHDAVIGDFCSFMPSVNISGEDNIGQAVYVGTGANLINQISIGENVTIGAGAVVTRDIPSDCTAVGVPAKPIKFK